MPRRSILSATERESLLALPDAKDEVQAATAATKALTYLNSVF